MPESTLFVFGRDLLGSGTKYWHMRYDFGLVGKGYFPDRVWVSTGSPGIRVPGVPEYRVVP